ncbi:response regulator receiver protein [Nitrosospira multiformis ATCC 25196]|uniref:Response regulator receiver domain protein (CheY-like) n=1 Tax=Nitrosospira multiformis (strain ATCC 25196 / NCIMB 11849 / C 71) TaxID=323848 RepID=Q2YAT7_NITMU|nr:response regulator [Nitrosospira multiformis]ABB74134.1 response regulator receiver domain protein (CheY-like) [Nitrosospira multiformis ATCC 25196]SEG14534.1 response regulator receiver protein [Nitrosospira multiformis ATCC 25196]
MNNINPPLSGQKVLVVDDEEDILVITRLMLELHGAEVITSLTAVEALEQVRMRRPDIVISDISMPHMDGYQFIQAVRNLPVHKGKDTPALALTAFSRSQDRERALNAGFQAHLSKPVSLQVLIETVAHITNLPTHSALGERPISSPSQAPFGSLP